MSPPIPPSPPPPSAQLSGQYPHALLSGTKLTTVWVMALCIICMGHGIPALGANDRATGQPPVEAATPGSVRSPAADAAVLADLKAELPTRTAAARRLLISPAPEARALMLSLLEPILLTTTAGEAAPDAQLLLIREVALMPAAPPWLMEPFAAIAESCGQTPADRLRRSEVLAAIGSIRTRDASRWLIDLAKSDGTATADAVRALIRLSGKDEFGGDLNRWSLWLGQVQWVSDAEWRRELAESLAARNDKLTRERDRAIERLLAELRHGYLAVQSSPDRSTMLADLLKDPQTEVRTLGLELATQELANARRLEPVVGMAAGRLLSDSSANVRRDAAALVAILAPADESARVLEALRGESDPEVAALLLRAAARWPDPALVPLALPWLESDSVSIPSACEVIDAVRSTWPQAVWQAAPRILAVLREVMPRSSSELTGEVDQIPAAAARLLFVLGDDSDREHLTSHLAGEDPAARLAIASALATLPEAVDVVVAAAQTDPRLFAQAAQSVIEHRADRTGFAILAGVPGVDPDLRREQLLALSRRLTHNDLYQVAFQTADQTLRESMLVRLLTEPVASQRQARDGRTAKPGVVAGLLLLYKTRVQLGRPAGALDALDALTPVLDRMDREDQDDRRTILLVWLNRLDEVQALQGSLDAWLQGLDFARALPHARQVVAAIDKRFGRGISGVDGEKLAALRLAIEHDRKPDDGPGERR